MEGQVSSRRTGRGFGLVPGAGSPTSSAGADVNSQGLLGVETVVPVPPVVESGSVSLNPRQGLSEVDALGPLPL